jgi:hypothetical protein
VWRFTETWHRRGKLPLACVWEEGIMKRVFMFVGLKIAEVLAVVGIPYGLGKLALYFGILNRGPAWLAGVVIMAIAVIAIGVGILLWAIVLKNWEWATNITKGD